jgi:hypothetical protein
VVAVMDAYQFNNCPTWERVFMGQLVFGDTGVQKTFLSIVLWT